MSRDKSRIERVLIKLEALQLELPWRSLYAELAEKLHRANAGQRNAREATYRQLLVAMLCGRRYECDQIADMLNCSTRAVQRDLKLLDERVWGRDESASRPLDDAGEGSSEQAEAPKAADVVPLLRRQAS